jgi:poly-gamma-glutamate synthesis protein (capsule biosynthesis protein)
MQELCVIYNKIGEAVVVVIIRYAAVIIIILLSVICLSCEIPRDLYSVPALNVIGAAEDCAVSPASASIEINTVTLSFVGDCMLASYRGEYNWNTFNYRADNEDPSYFFHGVSDIFNNDDFTVANCENVFTDNDLAETDKGYDGAYWYKSRSANASIFKAGGVDIISLANNHIYDYGEQGKTDTIAAADAVSLIWGDDDNPVILEKYGYKIALMCVTFMSSENIDRTVAALSEIQMTTDFQIIYFHGGTERVYDPSVNIINAAHRLADAGADLIIGHHPHVLQPIERYNGVNIVYSLGNFIFGAGRGENRTIIYQYIFNITGGRLLDTMENIIPCYCFAERWQPSVIYDQKIKKRVTDFLAGNAESPLE